MEQQGIADRWKILIVDDELEVHSVTEMVLNDYSFEDRKLQFISAYNSVEAREVLKTHPDIAVILLDVVMETETAGLDIVKWIRSNLKNNLVRIILRTGQPGQAPESAVIREYDINDYKEKTELTSQKLTTAITASIRSYRDLLFLARTKAGLTNIITGSPQLFEETSVARFAEEVLHQLANLLQIDTDSTDSNMEGIVVEYRNGQMNTCAVSGRLKQKGVRLPDELVSIEALDCIKRCIKYRNSFFEESSFTGYYRTQTGVECVVHLKADNPLTDLEVNLIQIISTNIGAAYENIHLNMELEDTQREVIFTLGEVVETRSKETGCHVKRVAQLTRLLCLKVGMSEEEANMISLAAPMHDIGKIGIPDNILNKPGKLNDHEFNIVKTHTEIGHDILGSSQRPLMKAASIIAHQHHERWDGKGYPRGLKGEEIHIYGRVIAIVDVYDALGHDRIYKEAWEETKIINFLKSERGHMFDPRLLDLFLESLDEIKAINLACMD